MEAAEMNKESQADNDLKQKQIADMDTVGADGKKQKQVADMDAVEADDKKQKQVADMDAVEADDKKQKQVAEMEAIKAVDKDEFLCGICLDLVYKPIVQSCGHIFCFWCNHRAMNNIVESHCAICRKPFSHFRRVCEVLHFLLFKMFPMEYRQRAEETLEAETQWELFSPQFGEVPFPKATENSRSDDLGSSGCSSDMGPKQLEVEVISDACMKNCTGTLQLPTTSDNGSTLVDEPPMAIDNGNTLLDEPSHHQKELPMSSDMLLRSKNTEARKHVERCTSSDKILIDDVLCCHCHQLLFFPSVLNCGHVFCQSCIKSCSQKKLICEVCQSTNPGDTPSVCLGLHHFLERAFPKEHEARGRTLLMEEKTVELPKAHGDCLETTETGTETSSQNQRICVHYGVGCDDCGVFPIVGKRYKCHDCTEKIGFDLCESCYQRGSLLPGRFNQQHRAGHRFVEDSSSCLLLNREDYAHLRKDLAYHLIGSSD
eukprot:TRINITY_DN5234_c0_g1_i1.p1 TRINITY_DN5234_c0_g1~~TRINITY_DN5234_c0_g1_i1.p1  ORF type:complete len:486 (+),score=92.79 TRINITY_DN5234_c0_g1_i1:235-1692(+)